MAEAVALGSLEDPGSYGKLALSQPGCSTRSCTSASHAAMQEVYVPSL